MLTGDFIAEQAPEPGTEISMGATVEPDLERITRLAAQLFDVPIATFSVLCSDRVILRSKVGIDLCETARTTSFCNEVAKLGGILVVPDATADSRFRTNPFVLGPPHVRFYAGIPVRSVHGDIYGTVSLFDTRPRPPLSPMEREQLADIRQLFSNRLESDRLDALRRLSLDRFVNIAETSPDAIICTDRDGLLNYWNQAAERLFGYSAREILGKPTSCLVHPDWRARYETRRAELMRRNATLQTDRTTEIGALRKDGTSFMADVSASSWREGGRISVASIIRDATERRRIEERLLRLASLDTLTGLANRDSLQSRLAADLCESRPLTLLLLDLDDFREINDAFGHSIGDRTLCTVADTLRRTCPQARQIARSGGDEFVILIDGDDERQGRAAAHQVIDAIARPVEIAGQEVTVGVSIGIALAPRHGEQVEDIMKAADLALTRARTRGRGECGVFTPLLRQISASRRAVERELHTAFVAGEFELFYQPQFRIDGRTLTGAEALIRWRHPERGLLTPAHFIKTLSQKPSAFEIGEWILRSACQAAATWRASGVDLRIGVNLFEMQLHSGRIAGTVDAILRESGLPPQALELEIVEDVMLGHDTQVRQSLHELRDLGIGLAFDDYGTGFASLALLKSLPITRLKIDQSFVRDIDTDRENRALVSSILYLADNFAMDVIAEGVESTAQLDTLRTLGCPQVQGYLFSRPVALDIFARRFVGVTSER